MEDEAGEDGKVLAVPTDKILLDLHPVAEAGRPEPDAAENHLPFLRALQGPGRRQVGQGAGLGRPGSAKKEITDGIANYAKAGKA
jgi:inorganic pyrophosphatase